MKVASIADKEYVAECFINISRYIKSQASDIYIDGLPSEVDQNTLDIAESYLVRDDAVVYIVEHGNSPVACIAGSIEDTSFGPSGIGSVGNISMCWVEQEYREQNIAGGLVSAVEDWFSERGIKTIELSYLAQNSLAETAWRKIGYIPFRTFSHKTLKN